MAVRRLLVGILALAAAGASCEADDDCQPGRSRCDGDALETCVGEAGSSTWHRVPCGDGASCLGSHCYDDPALPCPPAQEGYDRCNRDRLEHCTADGYWWADPARQCDTDAGETCQTGLVASGEALVPTAVCAWTAGDCDPATSPRVCSNEVALECAAPRFWVRYEDCGTTGRTCSQGSCR